MTEYVNKRHVPTLDARLSAARALASGCSFFADIGADHGRLSAVMLLENSKRKALVTDVSPLALDKARKRIEHLRLDDRTVFAVCDGLDALESCEERVDTVFILGMGGETICGILERGFMLLHGATLILSPHTDAPMVREALQSIGYRIENELYAHDAGRDYLMIKAVPAGTQAACYTEEQLLLGPILLKDRPACWLPVLLRREKLLMKSISSIRSANEHSHPVDVTLFERELAYVQNALSQMKEDAKA